jgi:hypothetical protein
VRAFAVAAAACVAGWLGYLTWVAPRQAETRPDRRFAETIRRHTSSHVLFFRAEAHTVAFHVGRPLHTLLEWENLDAWAGKATSTYVVMPADCAAVWRHHLTAGSLVEVLRTTDLTRRRHERPLVLMRTARSENERREASVSSTVDPRSSILNPRSSILDLQPRAIACPTPGNVPPSRRPL